MQVAMALICPPYVLAAVEVSVAMQKVITVLRADHASFAGAPLHTLALTSPASTRPEARGLCG